MGVGRGVAVGASDELDEFGEPDEPVVAEMEVVDEDVVE